MTRGKRRAKAEPVGAIDQPAPAQISGWVTRGEAGEDCVQLYARIAGKNLRPVKANRPREDVLASGAGPLRCGFEIRIPDRYLDGVPHPIELFEIGGKPLLLWQAAISERSNRCTVLVPEQAPHLPSATRQPAPDQREAVTIMGHVDGLQDGAVRGWVLVRHGSDGPLRGGQSVLVLFNGFPIAEVEASQTRVDVSEATGGDPNCGFSFVPPPAQFAGRTVDLVFKLMPSGIDLPNSPCRAAFPDFKSYRKIHAIGEEIDKLFVQIWQLRSQVRGLLPAPQYSLQSYHEWFQGHAAALTTKVFNRAGRWIKGEPLISVVCPVYKPRLRDFAAAVESVLNQSYRNIQLILVDDASGSDELTALIASFAERDSRVVAIASDRNEGISAATNRALAQAKGQYVAFFDHDDLLVERAIEVMVSEASRTKAQLLYCDEDKIDDSGRLTEPSFKPDWNYRLLLSQNYLCHLMMVDRRVLQRVGPLRSECNGAQDHDLVLRIAEILPPEKIHHVPEVLYHWRKTPTSTSGSGKSKPYAVAAGIKAISDHLARTGQQGEVSSPLGITCYQIDWKLSQQPKVTVIVPYREQIAMTRECVDALFANTRYPNFELLLIDNGSVSDEAMAFAKEIARRERVQMLRIVEPFNYSRLNNAAVAASTGDWLLFMNNDVVVSQPDWLDRMMGEALSDERVAAVGNKLLYPSGLVQHGGVILGVGGVADHAFRGLAADDAGFVARAICAQDLSAVTAACMLCRRSAFEQVGGFDEVELQVAYNDVDLCLKLRQAGYRIIWTPHSVAEHRESLSRGNDFKPQHQLRFFHENQVMHSRWKQVLENDPFYNRNFSRRAGIFVDLADHDGYD